MGEVINEHTEYTGNSASGICRLYYDIIINKTTTHKTGLAALAGPPCPLTDHHRETKQLI